MATYQFSALSDGQAISFNPSADILNFDQSAIAAADIRVTASGSNTRIDVVSGSFAGKDVLLLNVSLMQLTTGNVMFADLSQLVIGDNSTALNDNAGSQLTGSSGRDLLMGLGGNDTFLTPSGADVLDGGAGFDSVSFSGSASAVIVDFAAGTVSGGITLVSVERVLGSSFADRMSGAAGAQNLTGQGGADTLWGAAGIDTLWGGASADSFVFRESGSANADSIGDFSSGTDKIALDGTVMTTLGATGNFAAGDARFWAAAGATGGHDADDRVVYNTTTRQLYYDADGSGSGAAQLIATLQSGATFAATDIVVENGGSGGGGGGQVINGTAGDDTLIGTDADETINGFAGDDSLYGGEGADSLSGGDGNDTLDGHASRFAEWEPDVDTLVGGQGDDVFVVDNPNDVLSDTGGIDTVVAHNMDWTLAAGYENLVINNGEIESEVDGIGNELDNVLDGRSTQVMVTGGDGWHVHLDGRGGNDTILGSSQDDRLFGGAGNDSIDADWDYDILDGGAGNDTLFGGDDFEYDDTLIGGAGNDVLRSGGGDHFVFNVAPGAANADQILGFSSGADDIHLDATVMTALGASGNFAVNDARFYAAAGATGGHDADDRVVFNTTNGNLYYDADGSGGNSAQLLATVTGSAPEATDIIVDNGTSGGGGGGQVITGTSGNDSLQGGPGNDTLDGGAGTDTMNGGLGDDLYIVTTGDVLSDPGGVDTVQTAVNWSLGSEFENLTMTGTAGVQVQGNSGNNFIIGNSGNNYFNARAGSDTIQGGGGNDRIDMSSSGTGNHGNDVIDGGAAFDTIDFDGYATTGIIANFATGTIIGGDAVGSNVSFTNVEVIIGGAFADQMTGNAAGQNLTGKNGNDTLWGAGGTDTLWGGGGADTFVFREMGAANADRIGDFGSAAGDKIGLDDAAFTNIGALGNFAAGDGRFWAASGATAGHDADDRVIYNTLTGSLYYDADGSGAGGAQLIATFTGNPAVGATDITVI